MTVALGLGAELTRGHKNVVPCTATTQGAGVARYASAHISDMQPFYLELKYTVYICPFTLNHIQIKAG